MNKFHRLLNLKYSFFIFFFLPDSLSSGDDEDYDEDPEVVGNGNGEFLFSSLITFIV